jgi:hypothetical protein
MGLAAFGFTRERVGEKRQSKRHFGTQAWVNRPLKRRERRGENGWDKKKGNGVDSGLPGFQGFYG